MNDTRGYQSTKRMLAPGQMLQRVSLNVDIDVNISRYWSSAKDLHIIRDDLIKIGLHPECGFWLVDFIIVLLINMKVYHGTRKINPLPSILPLQNFLELMRSLHIFAQASVTSHGT